MALTKVPSNLDAAVSTTQSASDNSTNVATTAYVTTAIANLSDSAPAALNTLNEIAAALGDDANYASTTTAAIAAKLPLAGGSLTGGLTITASGDNLKLKRSSFDDILLGIGTGNSQSGIHITNTTDSITIASIHENAPAGTLVIDSAGKVGLGTASPAAPLDLAGNFIFKSAANTLYGNFDATTQAYAAFRLQAAGSNYGFIGQTSALLASGGSNTALGLRSENEFAIATGGSTERLRIDSSGNVGIGTTTPSEKFEVNGRIKLGGMILQNSSNGGSIGFNRNPASGAYIGNSGLRRFQINGPDSTWGDILQIQSYNSSGTHQGNINIIDGKLGIGDSSPSTSLHVAMGSNGSGLIDVARFENEGTTVNDGARIQLTAGASTSGAGIGCLGDALNSAHLVLHSGGNTERMRIDSSGRVLMGIAASTTPEEGGTNAGLEVVGSSSGRYNALRLSNSYTVSTGTASTGILFGAHTNGGRDNALIEVQNTQNGGDAIELQFHVRDQSNNLQKRHVINYLGNMHSQPDSANIQHFYGSNGGFMNGNSTHNIRAAGTLFMLNAGGGSSQIVLEINGANRGSVSSSSSSGVFSDRDMKENIQDIEIGLSEVLQLRPRKFKYKTGAHETYGFIAQEVETTVPLAVDEIELPEADPEANKTTLKTLDTTSLIAALVKSVQELEARLATLEG